ncbi:sigma 54-interacting transcriptional regulator, partial [Tetragenococcus koreensis]
MTNTEKIYDKIRNLYEDGREFTASELSKQIGLSRSMTSNYLNSLVKTKSLNKKNTRPVKFLLAHKKSAFDVVVGAQGSMATLVEQCQASVNYPPNGLPIILRGNSGVGKSMLAKQTYQYAKERNVLSPDAPLVTLNCADYANNPELLSSALFGYVKGAFTGADREKKGLLDSANGGYLFLDEVHNLTQENQEKLFILIDQKRFRRLGDDDNWQKADVRLILATTEDTNRRLLATFRRRIPLEITLPDFMDRPVQERLALITHFFQAEAKKMEKQVFIHQDELEKLLYVDVGGNVGAVQNKVQISCAQAYNQHVNDNFIKIGEAENDDKFIQISSNSSDELIEDGSYKFEKILKENFENKTFQEVCNNILPFLNQLKKGRNREEELFSTGERFIYSRLLANQNKLDRFGKNITQKHLKEIAILFNVGQNSSSLSIQSIDNKEDAKYFNMAQTIINQVHQKIRDSLLLYMITAYLKNELPIKIRKNAIILMHGKQSASSLSSEANNLIGDYVFEAFDMPIQVETKEIVHRVNEYVTNIDTREGLILLVDMGSLEKMYEEIKDNVTGDLLIVNNVSTSLALNIGFALLQNKSMDYFTELDYQQFNVKPQFFEGISQSQNIVISCMSGEGIAQKIKEIFEDTKTKVPIEIIVLDFEELEKIAAKKSYTSFKNTFAIISTSPITIPGVKCINIEDLVNGSYSLDFLETIYSSEQIRKQTNEIIKLFTIEGASLRLKFLNPDMVINEIEQIITSLEQRYQVTFKNFVRVNLFLHLSSMIERLLIGDAVEEMEQSISTELANFIEVTQDIFSSIYKKYNI